MTRATNRGAVLAAGGVAASTLTAAATGASFASAPDPIFDSIEAHRMAWARIVDAHENLEATLSKDEFASEMKALDRDLDAAKNKLLKTPPATLGGARAVIEYLIEWDKECEPETSYKYLSTFLRSPIFAPAEDADRLLADPKSDPAPTLVADDPVEAEQDEGTENAEAVQ